MSFSSEQYRFWAFISYSSKDAALAKKLHKRLETYSIPRDLRGRPGRDELVPKKLFPIFRDREELPLSADLGASIEDALRASRYLIVLCSLNSAQSRWVNEEIRYFKSLGREDQILAIILDGEPNASDDPDAAEEECFPPALRYAVDEDGELTDRRTEPIGGDLRPGGDGWTSVFLKAVAGITGLGYDAFARREQKRRRRRQMVMAAVALLVLIGGLWTWDYYRVKTDYYANVATAWGVPTGVGELNAEMRRGRQYHYRFYSSQRKVRRVERVNSAGTLRNDDENHGASVREVEYDEDGTLKQIDLRDHNGKLVLRKAFSEMTETPGGTVQYIDFEQEHQNAPMMMASTAGALDVGMDAGDSRKADISAHRVLYDDRGRATEITYFNAYRLNRANADGVFGQRFAYGESLLPLRIENLGYSEDGGDADPIADRGGVVAVEYERSGLGDETRLGYLGDDGRPSLNSNHFVQEKAELDPFGNRATVTYWGAEGETTLHRDGYHRVTQVFDERGNRTEQVFYGTNGEPTLHQDGYHRLAETYDERGNVVESAVFGNRGEPTLHRDAALAWFRALLYGERLNGYHRRVHAYDERGNVVEWAVFGVDGEPVLDEDGIHREMRAYDEQSNLVEWAFLGTDGEPTLHRDGYHRVAQVFDERGNVVEWAYFGADGRPVVHRDGGYHRCAVTYDERGNAAGHALYGIDGEPTLHRMLGYHRNELSYDDSGYPGNLVSYDTDGEVIAE